MPAIKKPVQSRIATTCGFRNAFVRGFGSAMSIHRCDYGDFTPQFFYRGRDIAKITSADALSQDWKLVGSSIASAFSGRTGTDESDSDR